MENIKITKETTVQSYGEFWNAFQHLKELIDTSQQGWSKIKLSALTMVCFSIEAFANHVGQHLFISWESIERGISPIGKLKLFVEMLKIELKYGESPFNTVNELMKWRNKVAHGETETFTSTQSATVQNYDQILGQIKNSDWKQYVLKIDISRIEKDCRSIMELIHKKAFGNLEWFLISSWHVGTAE